MKVRNPFYERIMRDGIHIDVERPKPKHRREITNPYYERIKKEGFNIRVITDEQLHTENVMKNIAAKIVKASVVPASRRRMPTGIEALDKMLGGGLIPRTTILLSGPRGVGKTTLCLQAAGNMPSTVYAGGEMTAEDLSYTAKRILPRINVDSKKILFSDAGEMDTVLKEIKKYKPALLVMDSIQTSSCDDVEADCGTPTQMLAVVNTLTTLRNIIDIDMAIIIIGHVNKNGEIAGPESMLHLVDAIVYLNPVKDEEGKWTDQRELYLEKCRFAKAPQRVLCQFTEHGFESNGKTNIGFKK